LFFNSEIPALHDSIKLKNEEIERQDDLINKSETSIKEQKDDNKILVDKLNRKIKMINKQVHDLKIEKNEITKDLNYKVLNLSSI
jgi:predicted  nucleic acid-binding Zn-ribbon protein